MYKETELAMWRLGGAILCASLLVKLGLWSWDTLKRSQTQGVGPMKIGELPGILSVIKPVFATDARYDKDPSAVAAEERRRLVEDAARNVRVTDSSSGDYSARDAKSAFDASIEQARAKADPQSTFTVPIVATLPGLPAAPQVTPQRVATGPVIAPGPRRV